MLHIMVKNIIDACDTMTADDQLREYKFVLMNFTDRVCEIIPNFTSVQFVPRHDMLPAGLHRIDHVLAAGECFSLKTRISFFGERIAVLILFPDIANHHIRLFGMCRIEHAFDVIMFDIIVAVHKAYVFALAQSQSRVPCRG